MFQVLLMSSFDSTTFRQSDFWTLDLLKCILYDNLKQTILRYKRTLLFILR